MGTGRRASDDPRGPSKGASTTIRTRPFIPRPWRPPAAPLTAPWPGDISLVPGTIGFFLHQAGLTETPSLPRSPWKLKDTGPARHQASASSGFSATRTQRRDGERPGSSRKVLEQHTLGSHQPPRLQLLYLQRQPAVRPKPTSPERGVYSLCHKGPGSRDQGPSGPPAVVGTGQPASRTSTLRQHRGVRRKGTGGPGRAAL